MFSNKFLIEISHDGIRFFSRGKQLEQQAEMYLKHLVRRSISFKSTSITVLIKDEALNIRNMMIPKIGKKSIPLLVRQELEYEFRGNSEVVSFSSIYAEPHGGIELLVYYLRSEGLKAIKDYFSISTANVSGVYALQTLAFHYCLRIVKALNFVLAYTETSTLYLVKSENRKIVKNHVVRSIRESKELKNEIICFCESYNRETDAHIEVDEDMMRNINHMEVYLLNCGFEVSEQLPFNYISLGNIDLNTLLRKTAL